MSAGISRDVIQRLHRFGSLQRVVRGIYLVGHPFLDQQRLRRCAVMLAGPGGAVSGRSALEAWRVLKPWRGIVMVSTLRPGGRLTFTTEARFPDGGLGLIRLRRDGDRASVASVHGVPVSSLPRALIDLAGSSDRGLLEAAWKEAEFRGLLDRDDLEAELARASRRGVAAVRSLVEQRRILTEPTTDLRSPGELEFLQLIAAAGLELPEVNVPMVVNGRHYLADFFYRHLGLVVELDTPDHLKPAAGACDRVRDVDFFVAGIDVIRFLEAEARGNPSEVMDRLDAALRRQRLRRGKAA